jgi:hypothetical protein
MERSSYVLFVTGKAHILHVLALHGPMTATTLCATMAQPMKLGDVARILEILRMKGTVVQKGADGAWALAAPEGTSGPTPKPSR